MGDTSTHAIFHSAYWHLAVAEDGYWLDTRNGYEAICEIDKEDACVELKR